MKEFNLTKKDIISIYKNGDKEIKKMLEEKFGADEFFDFGWMDGAIKFCIKNNRPVVLPYPAPKTQSEEWLDSCELLRCIVEIKNAGWVPDWSNGNQKKWLPYFKISPFGFADTYCGGWRTGAGGGSRLCFPTSEMAKETAEEFPLVYEKFLI